MDHAHLLRQAIANLKANPALLHSDEARHIMIEWFEWSVEAIESGDQTRRVQANPEAAPGIKMARLLTERQGHEET